uniref:Uncharacterized protein n=1 Tax=Xiphophorus couchianus TaxID=32473 RepID=A0A3B5M9R7_9TELE
MAVEKRLGFAIVQFLRDQTHRSALNSDEQESLEGRSAHPTILYTCVENTLCFSFLLGSFTIVLKFLLGNNHMKEENYRCAVECYTKAIDLDLRNAVYYCNRAAAHSKLGNYTEVTGDCERAIGIDPTYSKAYGRMGLALTAMNQYPEAISYFKKALVLDPENDTYKSNLKIAEQKHKEASSPIAAGLGFDMASLINNPAFISMVRLLVTLMSGMMSNAVRGPAAGVGGLSDISSLIEAGQQFAQQIQQQNPELIEQLRNHIRSRSFSGSAEEHS